MMLSFLLLFLPAVLVLATGTRPLSRRSNDSTFNGSVSSSLAAPAHDCSMSHANCHCFPSLGFKTPSNVPNSIDGWWCNATSEYAFLGFSYEVTACQSLQQLKKDFADMRHTFHSRYVRLYGACDREEFYDDVIEAAWDTSLGVHALIWFGFDGTDQWIGRRDRLFRTLHSNPKAKFVTRVVQFGSEPLFDKVLSPDKLAAQVLSAKKNLSSLDIPVTVSELAYGYQENGGAQDVLDAIDSINIHMLPFFSSNASTGKDSPPNLLRTNAWPLVLDDLNWFIDHGRGKKMYLDENGWPSMTSEGVQPNSPVAVADVDSEHAYYDLLDQHCSYLKTVVGGGVGWFAHIYSDSQEPGYGIYDSSGRLKSPFAPRTSC
ncbi:glycoside hydrolase family 17 protein [Russula decolorans]